MSTEVAHVSEAALAKDEKRKRRNENGETKKRKRDSETAAAPATDEVRPVEGSKKKRKQSHETQDNPPRANGTDDTITNTTPRPKTKKSKSQPKDTPDIRHEIAQSPTPTPTPKIRPYRKESLLQQKQNSPLIEQRTSLYLPLSPCATNFPIQGLCAEHLSPLLLTYYPPLHGVVLAYHSASISEEPPDDLTLLTSAPPSASPSASPKPQASPDTKRPAPKASAQALSQCILESGPTFIWLTASFLLFRPSRGTYLAGVVSIQNPSLLGLICLNYFNAVVERSRLPEDWRWVEGEREGSKGWDDAGVEKGYWVDGAGEKVEGRIVMRVEDFGVAPGSGLEGGGGGSVSITGTLLFDEEG